LKFKELKVGIEDRKAKGDEPKFTTQPKPEERRLKMMWAYNWYGYVCDKKQAKKWIVQWLTANKQEKLAKQFNSVKDCWIPTTAGWLARMQETGLELEAKELEWIVTTVKKAIEASVASAVKDEAEDKPKTNKPNIQEIMIERAHLAGGDIDGLWDEYISGDIKSNQKPKIQQFLADRNILAQHVHIIKDQWLKEQAEFKEAVAGTDADLSEAYGCYTKTQLKNMINYCAAVIAELDAYHQSKKAKVGVRKKKPVPPEKQVSKLKLLRKFEEFKLETVEPTKILKSSEMWVYNTKNRKLQYYVADEYAKMFTVKGTSILGFDTNKSAQKTLRKPQEVLKELRMSGKPDSRKLFDKLKTTSTAVNGRFNENLIIIKAT
jgi:hypothetical protein